MNLTRFNQTAASPIVLISRSLSPTLVPMPMSCRLAIFHEHVYSRLWDNYNINKQRKANLQRHQCAETEKYVRRSLIGDLRGACFLSTLLFQFYIKNIRLHPIPSEEAADMVKTISKSVIQLRVTLNTPTKVTCIKRKQGGHNYPHFLWFCAFDSVIITTLLEWKKNYMKT